MATRHRTGFNSRFMSRFDAIEKAEPLTLNAVRLTLTAARLPQGEEDGVATQERCHRSVGPRRVAGRVDVGRRSGSCIRHRRALKVGFASAPAAGREAASQGPRVADAWTDRDQRGRSCSYSSPPRRGPNSRRPPRFYYISANTRTFLSLRLLLDCIVGESADHSQRRDRSERLSHRSRDWHCRLRVWDHTKAHAPGTLPSYCTTRHAVLDSDIPKRRRTDTSLLSGVELTHESDE